MFIQHYKNVDGFINLQDNQRYKIKIESDLGSNK